MEASRRWPWVLGEGLGWVGAGEPTLLWHSVQLGPGRDKDLFRRWLSTYCLFPPAELGCILPHGPGHCPHGHLAAAILCLQGQLQAGEEAEGYPAAPRPHGAPCPNRTEAPAQTPGWDNGLPYLPSPMASVCTWTVKSCHELSWDTDVWP